VTRSNHQLLLDVVRAARRRLRLRQTLHGLSVVAAVVVVLAVLGAYGIDRFRFSPAAVLIFRVLVLAGPVTLAAWLLARPMLSPVSDERIALYLEEHQPTLDAHLLSGVAFARAPGDPPGSSRALVDRLVAEALSRSARLGHGRGIERPRMARSSGILAGATLVGAALLLLGPGSLRRGAAGLVPWGGERNPYRIDVTPGDTVVARGSDLKVTALLRHFTSEQVEIAVRRDPQGAWKRFPLVAESDSGRDQARHTIVLFNLTEATDYLVEAGGLRSAVVHVGVADLPHVKRIDLVYHFPAYSGLPDQRVEDGGDIAALRGTRVALEVTPTLAPAGASLMIGGKDAVSLSPTGRGTLTGEITVDHPASYRVLFQTANAGTVVGSAEYTIDVLADQPPTVRFRKPASDLQVTSVEEVFTEGEAHDDYGIARFELVYQVNGGSEQVVALRAPGRAVRDLVGSHTFALEEQGLKPGDVVSYYARAAEAPHPGGAQEARSDIYFLQVRPFEREYRSADEQPSMAGNMSNPGALSQRQREIVAGTFNLVRDQARYSEGDYRENLATLALAQGRLREEVQTLVGRIRERGIIGVDSAFAVVAEALGAAVPEMQGAERLLGERKPKDALQPEQRALQQLQRAEAAYREIQVARANGASLGGGNQRTAEELADLFDLEQDKLRNQYEPVERGRRQQADNQVDEALERLRELARRQLQENERLRARMQEMAAGAGGTSSNQRELADQAEQLARQLERLSREQSHPGLSETARRLREAADQMRRASAQGASQGAAQGRAALDQVREAQRLLEQGRGDRLKRDVGDAIRRAGQLREDQRRVQGEVSGLTGQSGKDAERIGRLDQRKIDMASRVGSLERDLDQLSRESSREQREASRKLAQAADGIRDSRLREKVLYSRGVMRGQSPEYARNFEDQIGSDIEALQRRLEEARGAIGEGKDQRIARALDRAGDLVTGLESMQERLRQQTGRAQTSAEKQGRARRAMPGADAGQGPPGGGRIDSRQLDRELRERVNDAQQLRNDLRRDSINVRDLDGIIQGLRALSPRLVNADPRAVAALESDVIQGLKEFEFALRRQFAEGESPRPMLTGADEVPEKYRKMVEEYYRALAGKKK
jgi:hypothetical protein